MTLPLHEFLRSREFMLLSDGVLQHITNIHDGLPLCGVVLNAGNIGQVFSPVRLCGECERIYEHS